MGQHRRAKLGPVRAARMERMEPRPAPRPSALHRPDLALRCPGRSHKHEPEVRCQPSPTSPFPNSGPIC